MAIKKAGLPNWYIIMYSIICIVDGLIGVLSLGFYTSNLQIIIALWYVQWVNRGKKSNSVMHIER